ncbi:hypothetical protein WMF04_17875 [Sorangium sp. So ce260]|uniref:hypothetical protein n=1 Tax=Sorangium sp. So ce260 TaxID=3133291 RepID=UPI003F616BC4
MTSRLLTASMFRRLAHAVSPLLLCALPLACVAGQEGELDEEMAVEEATQALSGFATYGWGTGTDLVGLYIPVDGEFCVLNSVTGNLGKGDTLAPGVPSTARVDAHPTALGTYVLWGHGGATLNSSMARVWANNGVFAGATCFPGIGSGDTAWVSNVTGSMSPTFPVKVANLDPNHRRQCFLSGVSGTEFTWNNAAGFARVVEVLVPDFKHPTSGWYIESNLHHWNDVFDNPYGRVHDGQVRVGASCIDFPAGSEIISGTTPSNSGFETYIDIDWRSGTKGCALTGITGKYRGGWYDGVKIEPPATLTGTWKIRVNDGRSASWACVL